MKEDSLDQIYDGFFEFTSLFHQKFSHLFHSHDHSLGSCNKNQNKTLMLLGRETKVTPTILGRFLDMKKGSLTTLIDSLEKMELIYREVDTRDRRKTWIYLTEKGKQYVLNQTKRYKSNVAQAFNVLEEKELDDFSKSMKSIIRIMKKL